MEKEIFVGLDVGTDSVGYAVTDGEYKLIKYKGEPMWGSTVFEAAKTKAERRGFRTARRRLDRRQQRVALTQEIFAKEIAKVDDKFFIRIKESGLYREDTSVNSTYFLFEEADFNDREYHRKYPTIHHLMLDMMQNKEPKDVRFVYLAVAWVMAHRGHFLNEVDKKNVSKVLDFEAIYDDFMSCFEQPIWKAERAEFEAVMLQKLSITRKEKAFQDLLNEGKKFKDTEEDSISKAALVKLLAGGKVKPDALFLQMDYAEIDSVSLGMEEEAFAAIVSELGDDGELLLKLRAIYDWALLAEILDGKATISEAKVAVYNQHKKDLEQLKRFVRKYIPAKYRAIFRDEDSKENYVAYSGHNAVNKCSKDVFSAFLSKHVKSIVVEECDKEFYEDMVNRLERNTFLPKQVDGDNRVIPYQLYWDELSAILENATEYLPFLLEKDEDGFTAKEKLMAVFEFRIPYFVGPLRTDNSANAWMKRKAGATGKIYPWNFEDMVDLDATEQDFINRMTNTCSYLPAEDVLPKGSLLYEKYMVLNEINNIKVNGVSIPVEVKQQIFEKFKEYKKVSINVIKGVLRANGCFHEEDVLSGLDITVKSSLSSYHAFKKLLVSGTLKETEVEEVITYLTYSEDKRRLKKWLDAKYSKLSDEDRKYISRLKIRDFGRLSRRLLEEFEGIDTSTGESLTMIQALWNSNDNLMQLLSERYTFMEEIEKERKEFYENSGNSIENMLEDMYISNSVKRPIYRTLAILEDVRKATKTTPKRIFIEMARGGGEKGKRTKSRRDQIKELYANFNKQEVRDLSKLLEEKSDNELQSEVLFLYFMQMGKCMYSGESINVEELKTSKYNVDHIYPQSKVVDDSISNKVLVLSTINGEKSDKYPLPGEIRNRMKPFWERLKDRNMISEEKYKRLTRSTDFSEEELQGFINRQLVETRQSTKALANILKRLYPETEIVYVKAGLVSEFRKEFDMLKTRSVNDLHHGKDAYLNIVCGNVYYCRFTKNFSTNQNYSLRVKTIFTHDVFEGKNLIWLGEESIAEVKRTVYKNNLHYTRFAFERKGGLFDQMPVKAGNGAVPRKANLPIEKYGGYNKSTASYYLLVRYKEKKKEDIMFMPVDLFAAKKVEQSEKLAATYAKTTIARIWGKEETEIEVLEFPLGMRKIKVNTVLSVNGLKVALSGKSSGGTRILLSLMEPLKMPYYLEEYCKRLERFKEKKDNKVIQKVDEKYDKLNKEMNGQLYSFLTEKLLETKYAVLFGETAQDFPAFAEKFEEMDIEAQILLLLNMLQITKTGRAGGCDLTAMEKSKQSAVLVISSKFSNLKKYNDLRIIDCSPSGIYETCSENLLELL